MKLSKIKWKSCAVIEDLRSAAVIISALGMKYHTHPKIEDGDTWVTYVK